MSEYLGVGDLFGYIANELNYTRRELASYLGTNGAMVSKWESNEAIPSQDMYRKMLHFAKIMDVDCSLFTIQMYIEAVLEQVYEGCYSIYSEINHRTNKVELLNVLNGELKWVEIEKITNKKFDLF